MSSDRGTSQGKKTWNATGGSKGKRLGSLFLKHHGIAGSKNQKHVREGLLFEEPRRDSPPIPQHNKEEKKIRWSIKRARTHKGGRGGEMA